MSTVCTLQSQPPIHGNGNGKPQDLAATSQNGAIDKSQNAASPAPSGVQSPRMQQVAMDIEQVLKRYETSSEAKRKAFLDALTPVQRQEFFRFASLIQHQSLLDQS